MPRHHKLLLVTFAFAAVAVLFGPGMNACHAGQIGPNGTMISRCNIGQTTAWDRQISLISDLAIPAIVSAITFVGALGAFIGFVRSRRGEQVRNTGRKVLGAAVGVMLAFSISSFAVCLAIVAMHFQS